MTTIEKVEKHLMPTYKQQEMVLVKGKNATCFDENGKEYVDFSSGIGVNSLGFAHPAWTQAVANQAGTLQHVSNLYYSQPMANLAEKLTGHTGYSRVFFASSGAEANECSIKVCRKYSSDKYGKDRHKILTLTNSFHGRSMATLTATGQPAMHQHFFPFVEGFVYANANDFDGVKALLDQGGFCAVMFEFIQGEGGVRPLEQEFVTKLFDYCEKNDILTLGDEVQTGMGRTGTLLAGQQFGVKPNVVSLAKGLGGGLPIGATLVDEKTQGVFGFSDHGSTFGGNPVSCAGANVVLDHITAPGFLEEVTNKGNYIREKLLNMGQVVAVDGMGMMLGIQLKDKVAADVMKEGIGKGLITLTAKEKLRLLPPLTITQEELDRGLKILAEILA